MKNNFFQQYEQSQWQQHITSKLEDLASTLSISNSPFNSWEVEFIENICDKLTEKNLHLTPKQLEIVQGLWDRI